MRNLSKKAKTIIAGAAIAGLASTGVAYAYWTTTGSGTATATTGSSDLFTVVVTAPADPLLLDQPQDVGVNVANGAAISLLTTVHLTVDGITGNPGTCLPAWYVLTDPTFPAYEMAVSSNDDFTGIVNLVDIHGTDQNGCKGASVSIKASAS